MTQSRTPEPESGPAPAPFSERVPQTVIEVRDLVKRYKKSDTNAVDGISFEVKEGEFFALLGPNGAGKTTTISILTTTLLPTSGTVKIGGYDSKSQSNQVRSQVGIVFQQPSLDLALTAEENVRFHAILYGLYPWRPAYRLMPAAYRARFKELSDVLGLKAEMFKPVKRFSGGMKRKLEIVRSLMHRPKVLFLDEPTAGLDADSRRNLWEYLKEIREKTGATVFLTTHYLEEAEEADTICIIDGGKIVSFGSPEDIKKDLVEEYLLVTPSDPGALTRELESLKIEFMPGREFKVQLNGTTVHSILKSIDTPLTSVRTHLPTLEDAYIAVLKKPDAPG
ncbi:MAG TPA: ABC transporter ATP-binding protein [Actinomycetota bacterium]|nr:ABC transporter ATP-binding protein [Actinomycetota bacterium]